MSTTTLTTQLDGDSPVEKPASCRRRCSLSRRVAALLVGGASIALLLTAITATVFGIIVAPDTPPAPTPSRGTRYGVDLRSLEARQKSPGKMSPKKSVGGILVEGGLRDPASGGGGKVPLPEPEEPEVITEDRDPPAVFVVTSRGGGGTGGRLVGAAGGGQLFFNPAADSRPVFIIRPAVGAGPGSVIVTSPGDLVPADVITEDATQADDGAAPVEADSENTATADAESSITSSGTLTDIEMLTNIGLIADIGLLTDTNETDSSNTTTTTTGTTTTTTEPPPPEKPLSDHLWLRAERGPLAVCLALQIVFFVLTILMMHGVRKHREDLVLLWLVSSAFGLAVGSAGAVLSALSAFDVGTLDAALVGVAYLAGLVLLWCGWAVVVAYHRQATPPEFDTSHPHFG